MPKLCGVGSSYGQAELIYLVKLVKPSGDERA